MSTPSGDHSLLAVIPARGGSKGLPGKNTRPFVGLPLLAHTIMFAEMCPEITRCIVSTDSQEIADVARKHGAEVPFLRPAELARDDSPIWPVLRHSLEHAEQKYGARYEYLMLLDPTSPSREPSDLTQAMEKLERNPTADGVIGVSKPDFNPIWVCVVERDGWMKDLINQGPGFEQRQDVPPVYRINGSMYIWRAEFARREKDSWRNSQRNLLFETPEYRAMSIDTEAEFERAEVLVKSGLINFPWLEGKKERLCAP